VLIARDVSWYHQGTLLLVLNFSDECGMDASAAEMMKLVNNSRSTDDVTEICLKLTFIHFGEDRICIR